MSVRDDGAALIEAAEETAADATVEHTYSGDGMNTAIEHVDIARERAMELANQAAVLLDERHPAMTGIMNAASACDRVYETALAALRKAQELINDLDHAVMNYTGVVRTTGEMVAGGTFEA